ncbi:hypothetical protein NC651_040382 [Populus alba x Populus x berolinensis]|nr:hypothetical protein NC651_040382 [Populus alba x Populus x berolinensis]
MALNLVGIVYMKVLRERDGIPDLRRAARFLSASVTLPKDRYRVIVMDADGSRSTDIARSLRKLGVKASIWNL